MVLLVCVSVTFDISCSIFDIQASRIALFKFEGISMTAKSPFILRRVSPRSRRR
jgi:hypothetical protein